MVEVENLQINFRSRPESRGLSEEDEVNILMEKVLWGLVKEAEVKIHQRVNQKFCLMLITNHIELSLKPHMTAMIDSFKHHVIKSND